MTASEERYTTSGRTVFLPVLTKARELEARVLLAAHLVRAGFQVVVGNKSFIDYRARFARNALYFCPSLIPVAEPRLRTFRGRGHVIIGWDEEGLVYPDPHWYFANRVGQGPAGLCDALIAWGPRAAHDWLETLPDDAAQPLALGNGRIDLLREPYRALHAGEAARLRERFGSYVLVNTNFDMVNHNDGPGALLRKMRESGRLESSQDEEQFARWEAFRAAMYQAFMTGLPVLHDKLDDVTIVLRPHPSESPAPYQDMARTLPRLFVEPPTGTVLPWIMGAKAVVHNSCTTAVESFMLDVPTIAYDPEGLDSRMESPLPNLLSISARDWSSVAAHVRKVIDAPTHGWITPDQQATAREYIGSVTGPHSSDRLTDVALDFDRHMPPGKMGKPPLLRRARRAAGELAERAGLRTLHNGADDLRRFPGLPWQEMDDLVRRISAIMGLQIKLSAYERDTYLLTRPDRSDPA